jgi:hypothetical protein
MFEDIHLCCSEFGCNFEQTNSNMREIYVEVVITIAGNCWHKHLYMNMQKKGNMIYEWRKQRNTKD